MKRTFHWDKSLGRIVEGAAPARETTDIQRMARTPVHFTSHQLPTWHPAAPRHNEHGEAQFASEKEVAEFEAKARDMGEDWQYRQM